MSGQEPTGDAGPLGLYDRWPYISLVMGLTAIAAAALCRHWFPGNERWFFFLWLHLPCFMLHQFEEYGWPGGFRPWWNRAVFGSRNEEFPLSRAMAQRINFPTLYLLFGGGGLAGVWVPWVGMIPLFATLTNGYFHISYAIATRSYVPGVVTSLLLYLPLTGWAAYHFATDGELGPWQLALAWALGVAVNVPVFLNGWRLVDRNPELLEAPGRR